MKGCANMNVQTKLFEAALCIEKPLYIINIIQEIKRRAKGFRNINYFISMIYLEAGNLRFNTIY